MRTSVEIPYERLSAEALRGVIEEFVTREGTDYGSAEYSFDDKVETVARQIRRGSVRIVFSPESESVHLVPTDELIQTSRGQLPTRDNFKH